MGVEFQETIVSKIFKSNEALDLHLRGWAKSDSGPSGQKIVSADWQAKISCNAEK